MLAVLDQAEDPDAADSQADHARARDAVMLDVHQDVIDNLKLFSVQTRCQDKNEFLTGRIWDEDSVKMGFRKSKTSVSKDRMCS